MIFGIGLNDLKGLTGTECYKVWHSMLRRAYSPVYQRAKPAYLGVSVASVWHKLSVFKEWFDENYVEGWQLDKDLLYKHNKLYSPSTSCFLPKEVNSALIAKSSKTSLPIGVYYKKRNAKYCAQVSDSVDCNRSSGYIGLFDTPEDAFKAYKLAKEARLKGLAEKYKKDLPAHVYAALSTYQVEISD